MPVRFRYQEAKRVERCLALPINPDALMRVMPANPASCGAVMPELQLKFAVAYSVSDFMGIAA